MIHAERKNWIWRGVTLGCVTGLIAGALIFAWSFVVHPVGKIEVGDPGYIEQCMLAALDGALPGLIVGAIAGLIYGYIRQAVQDRSCSL
jgi:membrane protease YdiL (CAAX protease family)